MSSPFVLEIRVRPNASHNKAFDLRPRDFTIVFGELGRDKRVIVSGDRTALQECYEQLCGQPELI